METDFTRRESLTEIQLEKMIGQITGHLYTFAVASVRKWGNENAIKETSEIGFFQLMPDKMDDGFFEWYCSERPYHQFFKSKETALLNFIHYWQQWSFGKIK